MNRLVGWGIRVSIILLFSLSLTAGAIPASILTNTGSVMEGSILGLASAIRLVEPGSSRSIGPAYGLEVPISSIKQITIDFPRVIIETTDKTLIGPFSAFSGLTDMIKLEGMGGDRDIPFASLRAIALNGNPLHPVPREWLGDRFLTEPEVIPAGAIEEEAGCASCTITAPDRSDETPIWNTIHPVVPPPEESSELPWWLGLIGVAALLGLIYFLSSGTGSS